MIATNAIWLAQSPGFIIEIYDEVSDTYGSSLITNDVLNSENIMIKVKNEVTNEPVKGVSVSINWNHKGGPANTIMDMNTTNSEGIVMFSKTDSWGEEDNKTVYINGIPYVKKYDDLQIESIYFYLNKEGYKTSSFSLRFP